MRFYILDDKIASVRVLENIVEAENMGDVIGTSTDPEKAAEEILAKKPDIVLIDLLMPGRDGISVVKEIRELLPDISFVMVSQVVEKEMIQEAYQAGIEFFITKPNNRIEIEKVIQNVIEKRRMKDVLAGIRSAVGAEEAPVDAPLEKTAVLKCKKILGSLGMLGEGGTADILAITEKLLLSEGTYDSKSTIEQYAEHSSTDIRTVKQRMRRAMKKGLHNAASLGVEDPYNDIFAEYGHILFPSSALRSEMQKLRGTGHGGGSPSLDQFLEGLLFLSKQT